MIFIAIDPGKQCGYVEWDTARGIQIVEELSAYAAVVNAERRIDLELHAGRECRIVCERYTITPQTVKLSRQYDALETIGALRYLARKHNIPFELQSRADRMRVSYDVLKQLDWYVPSLEGHANEALRHLIVAIARHIPYHSLVQQMAGTV